MQTPYFAIVELPRAITLSNSALGVQIYARMGGHEFQLLTPELLGVDSDTLDFDKSGDYTRNLGSPESASLYLKNPAQINWGSLIQSDKSGNVVANIRHLLAVFPKQVSEIEEFSESIHCSNRDWLERFDSFLRLISEQRTMSVMRVSGGMKSHFQLHQVSPAKHLAKSGPHITLSIFPHRPTDSATYDELAEAARLCSEGKEPPLHYQLLLKAYDAYQADDPRSTVIEASTALEVAATRCIRSILGRDGIPDKHVELVLKGHQTLTNRMKLLKSLEVKIPINQKNLDDEVVKIRNKVIHGGYVVTESEAAKLLLHAQKIIREITPDFAVLIEP